MKLLYIIVTVFIVLFIDIFMLLFFCFDNIIHAILHQTFIAVHLPTKHTYQFYVCNKDTDISLQFEGQVRRFMAKMGPGFGGYINMGGLATTEYENLTKENMRSTKHSIRRYGHI